jgi:hypothetical protein
MRKIYATAVFVIVSSVAFVAGMFYGFSEGARNYALLEQVALGVVNRHQLAALEKGKSEYVTHLFELSIDSAIDRYALYQSGGNKFMSEYFFPSHIDNLERYVDTLAEYRKTHPLVFNSDWALPATDDDAEVREFKKEGYEGSLEMLERIKTVLRNRGVPESALTIQPSPTR